MDIIYSVKEMFSNYFYVKQRKVFKKLIFGVLPVMIGSHAKSNKTCYYIYIHRSVFSQSLVVQVFVSFWDKVVCLGTENGQMEVINELNILYF